MNVFKITLGVFCFLSSTAGAIFLSVQLVKELSSEYVSGKGLTVIIGLLFVVITAGLYVKLTNFGIEKKTSLQRTIDEKEELKQLIEIAELKKRLSDLE